MTYRPLWRDSAPPSRFAAGRDRNTQFVVQELTLPTPTFRFKPKYRLDVAVMAPSLEEPTQIDLDAPLKSAPKLVAPEPGQCFVILSFFALGH